MKTLSILTLACLTSSLWAYTPGKVYKLSILHTNDHHGRFWENKEGEVGLAARATLIQQLRAEIEREGGHSLLIDAGDINTGIPQSDMQDAEPDFKGMGLLGYDVMALGNHEFDNPVETIMQQREWAGFPFISANIYVEKTGKRLFPSHIDKTLDDLKVTIFGLTTSDTPQKTNPINTKGLKFVPQVEEAKKLVPTLRPNTDVLIALTHIGHYPDESHGADAPGDVTLARQVPGIDVIVGGHTQKPLFEPDIQNGTVIVQAFEWGKYVGKVDLEVLDGKVKLIKAQLIPVNLKTSETKILPDPEVLEFLRPFKEKGDGELSVQLATSETVFDGTRDAIRFRETNLGNLVSAAYKARFKADLGITNSGGMRDSIYSGIVTYESILTVLPFGGEVVTFEATGVELKTYLEHLVFTLTPGSGSFPQMSGLTATADHQSKTLKAIKINGEELEAARIYKIAIPEFVANGGDKYPAVKFTKYGVTDASILRDFVAQRQVLKAQDFTITHYLTHENQSK
jgi:5'-nucleotidase/UDP-sugar diphosphatase